MLLWGMLLWGRGHPGRTFGRWECALEGDIGACPFPASGLPWGYLVLYLPHASATRCLTTGPEHWGKAITNPNLWNQEPTSASPPSTDLFGGGGVISPQGRQDDWQKLSSSLQIILTARPPCITSLGFHIFLSPTLSPNSPHKQGWFLNLWSNRYKSNITQKQQIRLYTWTKMSIIGINKLWYSYINDVLISNKKQTNY